MQHDEFANDLDQLILSAERRVTAITRAAQAVDLEAAAIDLLHRAIDTVDRARLGLMDRMIAPIMTPGRRERLGALSDRVADEIKSGRQIATRFAPQPDAP